MYVVVHHDFLVKYVLFRILMVDRGCLASRELSYMSRYSFFQYLLCIKLCHLGRGLRCELHVVDHRSLRVRLRLLRWIGCVFLSGRNLILGRDHLRSHRLLYERLLLRVLRRRRCELNCCRRSPRWILRVWRLGSRFVGH